MITVQHIIIRKIGVRLFMASMRFEGIWALALRRLLIKLITKQNPKALQIFAHVFIEDFEGLRVGDFVSINRDSNLSCAGGITIGDYVAIGHRTSILSSNHGFDDPNVPIKCQPVVPSPVIIGNNVWIGANVTILAGVSIADGSIIAAGAVVTKSIIEPNMIIGGVPAKPIKSRLLTN